MKKRNSLLDEAAVKKKSKLVTSLNSGILSVFGFLFFVLGIKKGITTQEGVALLLIGVVLLLLGIVRARMIAKLMEEVENMGKHTYESLTEEHCEEED